MMLLPLQFSVIADQSYKKNDVNDMQRIIGDPDTHEIHGDNKSFSTHIIYRVDATEGSVVPL